MQTLVVLHCWQLFVQSLYEETSGGEGGEGEADVRHSILLVILSTVFVSCPLKLSSTSFQKRRPTQKLEVLPSHKTVMGKSCKFFLHTKFVTEKLRILKREFPRNGKAAQIPQERIPTAFLEGFASSNFLARLNQSSSCRCRCVPTCLATRTWSPRRRRRRRRRQWRRRPRRFRCSLGP